MRFFSSRRGFTLFEAIVALTITVVLVGLISSAVLLISRNKRDLVNAARVQSSAADADEIIRRAVEQAGQRMFSAYNLSGINIIVAGPHDAARDTLITLSARGRAIRNSTKQCETLGPANCMVLEGDVTGELSPGDVVVTGNPQTGSRLLQVMEVQGPFMRPCGADCPGGEDVQVTRTVTGQIQDSVVVSHTINWKDGTQTIAAGGCPALEMNPSWASCIENKELRTLGDSISLSVGATSAQNRAYTEIVYADRTEDPFRYPLASTWTERSGAAGVPTVYTQQVRFGIHYLDDRDPERPVLVRRSTMSPSGRLGPPEPIAQNIRSFRVETQHRGETTLYRGSGVSAVDLVMDAGTNPNFKEASGVAAGGTAKGFEFVRSFTTISSVKVSYEVQDRRKQSGDVANRERVIIPMAVQVATPHLLDGGVIDTRVSEDGYRSTQITEGAIYNAPPIARLVVEPNPVETGELFTMRDNGSSDPDGTITSFAYDFGDGSPIVSDAGLLSATHTYSTPGTYYATLTVTDNLGLTGSHTIEVQVRAQNDPPIADFMLPANPTSGTYLTFIDASTDPDGTITRWEWSTSDGQSATGDIASFMFPNGAAYSITLVVTDNGGKQDTVTKLLDVSPGQAPPIAQITPPACASTLCQENVAYSWSGSTSYDTDGTITRYSWDWGDGTSRSNGVNANHTFRSGGTFDVRLTVTDDDGATGSVVQSVQVNASPVARLVMPPCATTVQGCYAGVDYEFQIAGSYDPDGDAISTRCSAPNWGTQDNVSPCVGQFSQPGDYLFTLTVTDSRGGSTTIQRPIKVTTGAAPVVTCPDNLAMSQNTTATLSCQVHNPTGSAQTYTFTASSDNESVVRVTSPASRLIGAGATATVNATLTSSYDGIGGSTDVTLVASDGSASGAALTTVSVGAEYAVLVASASNLPGSFSVGVYAGDPLGTSGSGPYARFRLGFSNTIYSNTPGLHIWVVDKATMDREQQYSFNTASSPAEADALADFLGSLPPGKIVLITSAGEWYGSVTENLRQAFYRLGLGAIRNNLTGAGYGALLDTDNRTQRWERIDNFAGVTGTAAVFAAFNGDRLIPSSILRPGERGLRGVRVTNRSTAGGEIDLTAYCGGELIDCEIYNATGLPISKTSYLAPEEFEIVEIGYTARNAGSGSQRLYATFGPAADTATMGIRIMDPTYPTPPIVSAPGNFSDQPGDRGKRFVLVENTWLYPRTFTLQATSTNPSVLSVSSGSEVYIPGGGSVMVAIDYTVGATAGAGATSVYGLTVTDASNSALTASATSQFTVSDQPATPIVIAPSPISVTPGETGSVTFRVVNSSNSSATYDLTPQFGGIVENLTGPVSVAVPAFDTVTVTLNYTIRGDAVSGTSGTLGLMADHNGDTGSASTTATTGEVLANPTVDAPADRQAAPGISDRAYFQITNNSNSQRTLTLSVSWSGVISSATLPSQITIGAGATVTQAVEFTMSGSAVADSIGTIEVTAADGPYSDSDVLTIRTSLRMENPTVTGTGDMLVLPGASGQKSFQVTNNTNQTRTITLVASRGGVFQNASVTPSATFAPFETRVINVSYGVNTNAVAGQTGTLTLTATDGSYSGSASVNATVVATAGVRISDVNSISFDPAGSTTFSATVSNTGNSDLTVAFEDASPAGAGDATNGYHTTISVPGSITIPASTSMSVTFSATLPPGAAANAPVVGAIRVYVVSDPSIEDENVVEGTVSSELKDPTVIAPANFGVDPQQVGTTTFQVRNNSNSSRTFILDLAYGGVVANASAVPLITLESNETGNVTISYTITNTAVAGANGTITLTAIDGAYTGSATLTVSANLFELAPTITGQHSDHTVSTGVTYGDTITVTNRTNDTRVLRIEANRRNGGRVVHQAYEPDGSTSNDYRETFAPFESRTFVVSYKIQDQAIAGDTEVVRYRAQDTLNTSLLGEVNHTVTQILEEAAPTVVAPANRGGFPDSTYTVGYQVTNNTNQARTFSFVARSGAVAVVDNPADPANVSFQPYETRTINVTYHVAATAEAGSIANVSLDVTDLTNPSLTGTAFFRHTTSLLERDPTIAGVHSDHTMLPGEVRFDTITVTNRTNEARGIAVYGTRSGSENHIISSIRESDENGVLNDLNAGNVISFGPNESKDVILEITAHPNAVAGDVGKINYHADDVVNPSLSRGATHYVTIELVELAPTISCDASNHGINPGQAISHTCTITNRTNAARTLDVDTKQTGTGSVLASTSHQSYPFAAYETRAISMTETAKAQVLAGETHSLYYEVTDLTNTALKASTSSHTLTVNEHLVRPTLEIFEPGTTTPVGAHLIVPNTNYPHDFRITNNSNVQRTYNLNNNHTASSVVMGGDPDQLNIVLGPYASTTVTRTHKALPELVAGTQASITWSAYDAVDTSLRHTNIHVVTVDTVLDYPSISGTPANHGINLGETVGHNFTVTNNSNTSRTFEIYLYDANNGNDAIATHSPATTQTIPAYQSINVVGLTETSQAAMAAGYWEDVRIRVRDTGNTTYTTSHTHRATINTVLANPTITSSAGDHTIDPGQTLSHSITFTNNSNVTRTFQVQLYDANDGDDIIVSHTGAQTVTVAPFASETVSGLSETASATALAGQWESMRSRVRDADNTTYVHSRAHTTTVNTVRANPTVTCTPASATINTGANSSSTCTVTNNSNSTRTFTITTTRDGTRVNNSTVSTGSLSIGPFTSKTVTLTYYGGSAGSGWARLHATDGTYTSYGQVNVTVNSYANPTVVCTPSSATINSGANGSSTCTITNNASVSQTFTITTSHDGTRVNNSSSNYATRTIAAGASTNVTLTYWGGSAGSGWARLMATAGGYSGYGQVNVTVNSYANPTVVCSPASATIDVGASSSSTCTITNNSSVSQTFTITTTHDGTRVNNSSSNYASRTIGAGASTNVTLTYWGGSAGSGWARLVATAGSYSGNGQVNVTVVQPLANPTVTAPSVRQVWRNQSFTSNFSVKNNSAVTRTLCFTATAGSYINDPADPACSSFTAGQTKTVGVTFTVQNYNGDRTSTVTLRAYDQGSTGYQHQASQSIRIPADPTVTVDKTRSDGPPGSWHSATWTLHHNSQWPITYFGTSSSGNLGVADRPADVPSQVTLSSPGQTFSYTASWQIKPTAPAWVETAVGWHWFNQGLGHFGYTAYWDWNVVVYSLVTPGCSGSDYCDPSCPEYNACACDPCSSAACPGYDPCACNPCSQGTWCVEFCSGLCGDPCTTPGCPDSFLPGCLCWKYPERVDCYGAAYASADIVEASSLLAAPDIVCDAHQVVDGQPVACSSATSVTGVTATTYDWGDGSPLTVAKSSEPIEHVYAEPGVYTVTAYAVGGDGEVSAHRSVVVRVHENRAPSRPTIEPVCVEGACVPDAAIQFRVHADDPDMSITGDSLALVHVDLGDGRAVWAQAGEPITVSYEKAGTYVVSARVYDRAGLGSIVGHGAVTVQPSVESQVACSLEGRQVEPGTVVPIHVTYNAPIGADMATLTIGDAEPVGVRLDGASAGTFVLEHVFQGVGPRPIRCELSRGGSVIAETLDVVQVGIRSPPDHAQDSTP